MIIPAAAAALAESQSRDGSFAEGSVGQLQTISFYRNPSVLSLGSRRSGVMVSRDLELGGRSMGSGGSGSEPSSSGRIGPAAIAHEVVQTMERMGLLSSADSSSSRGTERRSAIQQVSELASELC